MKELRKHLLEQGIKETEIEEVLEYFDGDVAQEDVISTIIYNSAFELGSLYADEITSGEEHIKAVLDHAALGKHIVENDDGYLLLKNGRVIWFELK